MLKEPQLEIQDPKRVAKRITEMMNELGNKRGRHWKTICTLVDLWISPRGWYSSFRLTDLEVLIEQLASK